MSESPIRQTDDAARMLAAKIMEQTRYAALGVLHPESGAPFVTRIAFALDLDLKPLTLISTLAMHTTALRKNPLCSLLIGEMPDKGDALAFARLTLNAQARFLDPVQKTELKSRYLTSHPKAKLYFDFADFQFVKFDVTSAALNGGFGKAYELDRSDLPAPAGE